MFEKRKFLLDTPNARSYTIDNKNEVEKMGGKSYLKGHVDKVKVLKLEEMPLVRFTLVVDENHRENCLIKQHSLNFLFQASEGKTVIIYGKRNSRNQFVVKKYHVN